MTSMRAFAATFLVCLSVLFSSSASADEWLIREHIIDEIRSWSSSPVILLTLEASNERYASLDQAGIDALDKQWRAEREVEDQPLITAVLSSPLSNYLTRIQARSRGLYTEIFVMDAKGLNAGQSSITSDFWQGDEGKWQKTFQVGPDAIFIDEIEINEDTGTENAQVNLSIAQDGQVVGAITVEVNVTELRRRYAAGKV
ncbi:hypothetical protein [Pelagibius marinus]|uniref:hypothetical protein n=1 Tax=Pelagibius marinus TaxID=2762760 RepID=UPI00187303B7|nr:hypothetical protein [Pelagibius marinus]